MEIATRRGDDGLNVASQFGAHQPRRAMPSPVLGREIGIRLCQLLKRCQKGTRLLDSNRLCVTIAKHRIRIGCDTPVGETTIEVPYPRMQPTKRSRNAISWTKQAEQSSLRASFPDALREPRRTEILRNDAVNVRKPAFAYRAEQAGLERSVGRFAERQCSNLAYAYKTFWNVRGWTREHADSITEQLCRTNGASSQEKVLRAYLRMRSVMMDGVLLPQHGATGTLKQLRPAAGKGGLLLSDLAQQAQRQRVPVQAVKAAIAKVTENNRRIDCREPIRQKDVGILEAKRLQVKQDWLFAIVLLHLHSVRRTPPVGLATRKDKGRPTHYRQLP